MRLSVQVQRFVSLLVGLLVLGGCAAEAEPEPIFAEPEPTASPSPTTDTPGGEDPHRSPKALIRHWNHLQNEMQKGDTTEWRALTPDCTGCASFADQVDDIYAAGGYIETDGQSIVSIRRDHEATSDTTFLVTADNARTEYRESDSGQVQTLAGGAITYRVYLANDSGTWTFRDYAQVPQ